jgi:tetratricopeptide (TPR) repeat protein
MSALVAIAYVNAWPNSFHFDDIEGIVRNPMIRDVGKIPSYFTDIKMSVRAGAKDYRPVVLVSYALDYARSGLDPSGFRMTNMAIHILVAWLLFTIAENIFERRPLNLPSGLSLPAWQPAGIAAALFAVHTVNSEAVDYIWARSASLAALFYLASFYCFMRGPWGGTSWRWHIAGLLGFVIGLCTKATIVTLPVALILYEMLILAPPGQEPLTLFWREPGRLKKYLPVGAVFFGYVLFRFVYIPGLFMRIAANRPEETPPWVYLVTQFRAWVYYIRLYLWPHPLITDYAGFGWSRSLADAQVLFALAIICMIVALALWMRRANPVLTFFIAWFFVTLLPEASFIPLATAVNGYRPYLAYAGLSVAAAILLFKATAWFGGAGKAPLIYAGVFGVILCSLVGATLARNLTWRNEATLWDDVLAKDPTNARAYANLALRSAAENNYSDAFAKLDRAISLDSTKDYPYMLRGYLKLQLQRYDDALDDLTRAIELWPRSPFNFFYRGELYRRTGQLDKALADYRAALALLPFYTDSYISIALTLMDKSDIDGAIEACRKVLEIDANDPRSYHCLGSIAMEQQRYVDAIRAYQRGIERRPRDSGLWYGLGSAYEAYGMFKPAAEAFDMSSRLTQ